MAWLQAENLKRSVSERLLYSVMLLKAVALALREFPDFNGFWMDGAFKPGEGIHIGVAISLRLAGLVAPAIHDLDKMSLSEIMVSMRDLVKRVRAGVLRSQRLPTPPLLSRVSVSRALRLFSERFIRRRLRWSVSARSLSAHGLRVGWWEPGR